MREQERDLRIGRKVERDCAVKALRDVCRKVSDDLNWTVHYDSVWRERWLPELKDAIGRVEKAICR